GCGSSSCMGRGFLLASWKCWLPAGWRKSAAQARRTGPRTCAAETRGRKTDQQMVRGTQTIGNDHKRSAARERTRSRAWLWGSAACRSERQNVVGRWDRTLFMLPEPATPSNTVWSDAARIVDFPRRFSVIQRPAARRQSALALGKLRLPALDCAPRAGVAQWQSRSF